MGTFFEPRPTVSARRESLRWPYSLLLRFRDGVPAALIPPSFRPTPSPSEVRQQSFADTPMSGATSTTTPISGEAAELVNKQETLNWRAFCRRAQPTPSQAMASRGRQTGSRILQCTTAGCGLDEPHLRRIFSRCEWFRGRLGKDVPLGRAVQRSGVIVAIPILSGLHQYYVRI